MEAKDIRKQLRNVVKENIVEVLNQELVKTAQETLALEMNRRLDNIEKYCSGELNKQDERAKGIQKFVLNVVQHQVAQDLINAQLTMDAIIEVLAEAGFQVENLSEKVAQKKTELGNKKKERDLAAMKETISGSAKESS